MSIFDSIEPGLDRFGALTRSTDSVRLNNFIDVNFKKYCNIFREKSYMENVEWMVRHYLASKKIVLSALFYTQAEYMLKRNMKNLAFYACYYAYFNALSSNLILCPHLELNLVRSVSHGGLATKIENFFVRRAVLDPEALTLLGDLRFARELYSYHLPLAGSGKRDEDGKLDADRLFRRLTELMPCALQVSNMLSYLSYAAFERKGLGTPDEYDKYRSQVDSLFNSIVGYDDSAGTRHHFDEGDYYQLGRYLVKLERPMPIGWLIHDWTLDELESYWTDSDDEAGYSIGAASEYLSNTLET